MRLLKHFGHVALILLLTVMTQLGGLICLLTLYISKRKSWKKRYAFPVIYLIFNLILIPPIASIFGRERLPVFNENISARNWFYPLAFRNYATPELKTLLLNASKSSAIKITYLDANFPFINGFPLLPHLSHNDGKKIDIAFMYLDNNGSITDRKPSVSGYGSYVNSKNSTSKYCINSGYWQYDFTKYLTFGTHSDLFFDNKRTKILIEELVSHPRVKKVFIEPYLKQSLGLQHKTKVRFHGCQAVRHDDHIHLEIN